MKTVLSIALPALLLMSATAFAAGEASDSRQPSGGSAAQNMSAGTGDLQGAVTGAGNMNGPNADGSAGNSAPMHKGMRNNMRSAKSMGSDTSSMSASSQASSSSVALNSDPTYQGGRKGYHGKSTRALDASEAQETAQLNQQYGVTNR